MSIVMYYNKSMYSDSAVKTHDYIECCAEKIFKTENGILFGVCGDLAANSFLNYWAEHNFEYCARPDMPDDINLSALVYMKSKLYSIDNHKILTRISAIESFVCIGSGAPFAMGAMATGASPESAISIACKYDTGCMLPIQKVSL